jgi:hypothetical protein
LEKRRGSMRALAGEVAKLAQPVLGKRGFAAAQLVTRWADIVGADWAAKVAPEKLSFPQGERRDGTLRLRVASGCAPEVQHRAPLLLERINGFFGYGAVARIALVQGPVRTRPKPPPLRQLAASESAALEQRLAAVADPELRQVLRRLGEAVIGTGPRG